MSYIPLLIQCFMRGLQKKKISGFLFDRAAVFIVVSPICFDSENISLFSPSIIHLKITQ